MSNLTEKSEWLALQKHQSDIADERMRDWFMQDKQRFSRYSLKCGEILLDYSRNRINDQTLSLLCALATASGLPEKIDGLFTGHPVNITENRPALHTALRDKKQTPIQINDKNIAELIAETQQKMRDFCQRIHLKTWKGKTGKAITHIVNIGIGGSYLGPMMCTYALHDFAHKPLQFHFISTVDAAHQHDVLQQIDPEVTLFIVSSKSFTTLETMTNAETIAAWLQAKLGKDALKQHFIAITANTEKAIAFGIAEENIFPLWDWVGGRYSIWSAIGLPLMLMIGEQHFSEFLEGAYEMDKHFHQAPFSQNMPVLLALLGIWYMNFFGTKVHAIVPYVHHLRYLIPYLQQAEMESNGKTVNTHGIPIPYATGPVIFGAEGCNGQHAYHQLLHQGQHLIPTDFILVGKNHQQHSHHQDILIASALSQAQALMRGKTYEEAYAALLTANHPADKAKILAKHQVVPGNKPSNILFLEKMTPKNLGALITLYEHKIFVQGAIWDINSFDQWGVELGKQLLPDILNQVQGAKTLATETDSATEGLIQHFRKIEGSAS